MTTTDARTVAATLCPLAVKLLKLRRTAKAERIKADLRHAAILADGDYRIRDEYAAQFSSDRILDPKIAYLMRDEQAPAYYAACDAANRAAGYDLEPGYCPALVAENAAVEAEHELIRTAGEVCEDLKPLANAYGENRAKALDLLIGLATAR